MGHVDGLRIFTGYSPRYYVCSTLMFQMASRLASLGSRFTFVDFQVELDKLTSIFSHPLIDLNILLNQNGRRHRNLNVIIPSVNISQKGFKGHEQRSLFFPSVPISLFKLESLDKDTSFGLVLSR